MSVELSFLPKMIFKMSENFKNNLRLLQVSELEKSCILFVEDGNHGEYRPLSDEFVELGVPFVRPPNLENGRIDLDKCQKINAIAFERVRKGIGKGGDIVLTHNATIGRLAITNDNDPVFVTNPQTTVWRSKNRSVIDNKYLYYFMCSSGFQEQLESHKGRNATFDYVSLTKQRSLVIPVLPIETQRAIGQQLSILDDKIHLNHQINQTLEQMAQAIFKSWFVDFEPVKAKVAALEAGGSEDDALLAAMQAIAGSALFATDAADADAPTQLARLQSEHPEQYTTLRATAELFPSAMQESELGEVPEGWEAKPFGELLIKTIGGDWGKEEPDEKHTEKVKILRGTDLPHVYAGSDDKVPTRYVDPKKLATRKLENGDIVIEVSGGSPTQPTGRSLYLTQEIINRLNADLEPASFCRLFRPESKEAGLILGLHLQKIYGEGKTWLYQNTSTGISNFQTKMFLEKELIVLPPLEMQASFYTLVMPYLQKISSAENKVLAELRDVLLPKLLSGELSLAVAEEQLTDTVEPAHV